MESRRATSISALAGLVILGACGEEVAEQRTAAGGTPPKPACELIQQIDLEQIFVNPMAADEATASMQTCTWIDTESGEPFVEYEVLPYEEDLQAHVDAIEEQQGESVNAEFVNGIGDAAVWTDAGLIATRAGFTLQVRPLREDENRAPYQELARLLLTRLEGN